MRPVMLGKLDPNDVFVVSLVGIDGALRAYRAAGGVLDYCLIHVAPRVDQVMGHRIAAATMIKGAGQRYTDLARQRGSERVVAYRTDAARATFEPITVEQFVGPFYDWSTGQLKSAWVGGSRRGQPNGPMTHGYADAFGDPPYRLRAPFEKTSAWFWAMNVGTFGGFDQDLIVYRYSTQWSEYFDAGHEWWGSHCRTVQAVGSPLVTAIGASTTD